MSTTANHRRVEFQSRSASVPWYIWAGVLAVTSSSIGGALGRLLAPLHRPRYFLDPGAHGHLRLWCSRRNHLCLADCSMHVCPQ